MSRGLVLSTEHAVGIASGMASFFVVVTFGLFPDLRSLRYMQLVFFVALNDMIASIAISIGHAHAGTVECWLQGVTVTLNYLSSIFWTTVISYQVWLIIDRKAVVQNMKGVHVFCWGLPLFLTLIPLTTNTYGSSPAFFQSKWCFISARHDSPQWGVAVWSFASFFLWIFISVVLNCYFLIRVYFAVRRMDDVPQVANYTLRKLIIYPMITIICWLPSLVLYIFVLFDKKSLRNSGDQRVWRDVNVFAVATAVAQGFLNSVVFLWNNRIVRVKWKALLAGDFSVLYTEQKAENEDLVERADSIFSSPDFLSDMGEVVSARGTVINRDTELSATDNHSAFQSVQSVGNDMVDSDVRYSSSSMPVRSPMQCSEDV